MSEPQWKLFHSKDERYGKARLFQEWYFDVNSPDLTNPRSFVDVELECDGTPEGGVFGARMYGAPEDIEFSSYWFRRSPQHDLHHMLAHRWVSAYNAAMKEAQGEDTSEDE